MRLSVEGTLGEVWAAVRSINPDSANYPADFFRDLRFEASCFFNGSFHTIFVTGDELAKAFKETRMTDGGNVRFCARVELLNDSSQGQLLVYQNE